MKRHFLILFCVLIMFTMACASPTESFEMEGEMVYNWNTVQIADKIPAQYERIPVYTDNLSYNYINRRYYLEVVSLPYNVQRVIKEAVETNTQEEEAAYLNHNLFAILERDNQYRIYLPNGEFLYYYELKPYNAINKIPEEMKNRFPHLHITEK